jgi:hypothetical protein
MIVAFSSADQFRRRPAPVNTSMRRTGSGICLGSEIDMCRNPQPAPSINPQASNQKVAGEQRLHILRSANLFILLHGDDAVAKTRGMVPSMQERGDNDGADYLAPNH